LAVLLLGVANAKATEFDSWYLGINAGSNKSSATGLADKNTGYLGLAAGYNWDMRTFLLGVDGFVDTHGSSHTGQDAGVDVKLGLPLAAWLPYAKLGVEYKFAPQWSVYGEWTTDKKSSGATDYKNNNLLIGVNYYLEGGRAAASEVPASDTAAREAAARDAAAREAAAREAAAREAAARDAAARNAAARDAAARDAAAREAAAKEAAGKEAAAKAARESWKTSIIEKPVRLEGANFASGSSKLLASAGATLDEVVNAARQFPDIQLQVMGYTDNIGNAQSNLRLSRARAEAVKGYLVKQGVAAERITSQGFGADSPVADNASAEGRAKNRRVEIHYTVKEEKKVRVTE
jgi:OOP family OmpA-OmpF porin